MPTLSIVSFRLGGAVFRALLVKQEESPLGRTILHKAS